LKIYFRYLYFCTSLLVKVSQKTTVTRYFIQYNTSLRNSTIQGTGIPSCTANSLPYYCVGTKHFEIEHVLTASYSPCNACQLTVSQE